jgi:hypothetical protein
VKQVVTRHHVATICTNSYATRAAPNSHQKHTLPQLQENQRRHLFSQAIHQRRNIILKLTIPILKLSSLTNKLSELSCDSFARKTATAFNFLSSSASI